jgi:hypothetical protein
MSHLLSSMLSNEGSNLDSVAAVLASWYFRIRFLVPAEVPSWKLMCYPVMLAVGSERQQRCATLVGVLYRAVVLAVGEQDMSVQTEAKVARELGGISGSVAKRDELTGSQLLSKLMFAMPHGTTNGDSCLEGYKMADQLTK